jgi:hypothetical protein
MAFKKLQKVIESKYDYIILQISKKIKNVCFAVGIMYPLNMLKQNKYFYIYKGESGIYQIRLFWFAIGFKIYE